MRGDISRRDEMYQDIAIIFGDISPKNVDVEMCGDVSRRIETYKDIAIIFRDISTKNVDVRPVT